ncbi:MAG: D-glycerate dehydrogenase [Candidatus Bathyarchaeota archaeon]|nr:D-glycerate dehydrogenase [Candidatus Bathyarchaeota archaeon]
MKRKVLISVGRLSFPEDVAETLSPLAEVIYAPSRDFGESLNEVEVVIVGTEPVDDSYLDRAPKLKLVSRFGVGYDSVDIEACKARKIYITHTIGVLSEGVAEHTWALILGLMKRIPQGDRHTREEWALRRRALPFGSDLLGKTLGLVGLGAIGSEVAKRALGFGVKLIYYDIVRRPELESEHGMKFAELDELLRSSDIVTLHTPLLPSTRGLMGEEELEMMKPTAVIINTSRGPVVNQEALVEALENGRIAGAALDVFEAEPIPLDDRLLEMENVVVTPHIASATWETRRKMAESCVESVREFLEGKRPRKLIPEMKDTFF